jgi:predicted DsbA family dithiol-disulfide isomerase
MPLTIDLFTDIVCPWCLIGTRRIENVLASLGDEIEVDLVHHPFLLNPATPPEGTHVPTMLRRKYGADPLAAFARVEAEAHRSGIDLDSSKQQYSYPSVMAHTLVRHARPRGTQRALAQDLFAAHFLEARNISDVPTLVEIAERHGFTAEEAEALVRNEAEVAITRAAAAEASEAGIRGVPFFIFDRRFAVSGCQPEIALRQAIARAAEVRAAE